MRRYRPPGLGKRQKELRRADRQEAKAARKAQRREDKRPSANSSELWELAEQHRKIAEAEPADQRAERLKMAEYLEDRARQEEDSQEEDNGAL